MLVSTREITDSDLVLVLSFLTVFVYFLQYVTGQGLQLRPDCFLSHPFLFIDIQSLYLSSLHSLRHCHHL
jgi:hypothetical protein